MGLCDHLDREPDRGKVRAESLPTRGVLWVVSDSAISRITE